MRYRHVTYRRRRNGSYDVLRTGPFLASRRYFLAAIIVVAALLALANTIAHNWGIALIVLVVWCVLVHFARKSNVKHGKPPDGR